MGQEQQESENPPLSPELEPVKHLSPRLQKKLLKREQKQRKHFRSSGKPYPIATMASSSTDMEATGSTSRSRQRLILAIASLVIVMLLALALFGIAIALHAASWIFFALLLVVVLLAVVAVVINIVFNRKI